MMLRINSKRRRTLITSCISFSSCLVLAIALFIVYMKIQTLKNLETSLDRKLRNIELLEGRIGKLHHDLSVIRRRRETHVNNETLEDDQNDITAGNKNDDRSREGPSKCNIECSNMGGATYTRWGRKNCSDESETIYEGVVGGSHYTHTGGAVNPVCLPKFPLWNRHYAGLQEVAHMFGTEYQKRSNEHFSLLNATNLFDENMPCAVCRSKTHRSVITIPARNVCYPGWTLEYQGYLMAGHHTHKKGTMYICVDEAPEVTESGFRDENGQLFYVVEARCGSLPCPEYIEGRELTCAVCSK